MIKTALICASLLIVLLFGCKPHNPSGIYKIYKIESKLIGRDSGLAETLKSRFDNKEVVLAFEPKFVTITDDNGLNQTLPKDMLNNDTFNLYQKSDKITASNYTFKLKLETGKDTVLMVDFLAVRSTTFKSAAIDSGDHAIINLFLSKVKDK